MVVGCQVWCTQIYVRKYVVRIEGIWRRVDWSSQASIMEKWAWGAQRVSRNQNNEQDQEELLARLPVQLLYNKARRWQRYLRGADSVLQIIDVTIFSRSLKRRPPDNLHEVIAREWADNASQDTSFESRDCSEQSPERAAAGRVALASGRGGSHN